MLRMLLSFLSSDGGVKRAETIRKSGLFHHFGGGGYWHPLKIPADMKMISIGDRVTVCADVDFITHDLNHRFFNDSARFDTRLSDLTPCRLRVREKRAYVNQPKSSNKMTELHSIYQQCADFFIMLKD